VVTLIILFFLVVFAFPEKLYVIDSLLVLSVVFSPAAVLLYERGNVDLVFFILCGLAIMLVRRSPAWTVAVLSIAAIFKMFPFFGVGIFLRENKQDFYKYLFASALIFGVYIALTYEGLSGIWNLTARGTFLSYGDYIIFDLYHAYFRYYLLKLMTEAQVIAFMKIVPHLIAMTVLSVVFWLGIRSKITLAVDSERNLTAFRMGACIYIGTFLLGNNWDYRLSFLIFTIPQISRWIFSSGKTTKILVALIFAAMLASCWYTALYKYFFLVTNKAYALQFFTFDETMNWILFAGLAYLLTVTAPQWFRSFSWNPFSPEKMDGDLD